MSRRIERLAPSFQLIAGIGLAVIAVFGLFAIGTLVGALRQREVFLPEIALPILALSGVIVVLIALGSVATLLDTFGLTDHRHALALPEGTIRAVLAVTLVLMFPIMTLYLYSTVANATATSTGITAEQVEALPDDRIVSMSSRQAGGETVYDVQLRAGSTTSDQLAQQLVTIVGTLVASLAAFYFGAQSVRAASDAVLAATTSASSLHVLSPTGDATLDAAQGTQLTDIRIATVPADAVVDWELVGDGDGELAMVGQNVFRYTRGTNPADVVELRFSVRGDRDTQRTIRITKP